MIIPRFERNTINTRLAPADIGDAFQRFVYDVLVYEHPQLHRFPGGGKDGGIDLIDPSDSCVFECKVIGKDGIADAEKRWNGVRNNLRQHLHDPSGPTTGQSQYGPWYSTAKPIGQYVFCVSSALLNAHHLRSLEDAIEQFFRDLARQFSHLSHLSTLKVSVLDWNSFTSKLRLRPHIVFRWFPSCRPNGLVPLDENLGVGTFRAYLSDSKLPYYSLAEHLQVAPVPDSIGILNEERLLAHLENPETTGLVISGKGGIGKSRLTLELGWRALRKGWTVMRVESRLKENALEDLAERLTPELPALLLIDYIETQTDFGELVENLNVLNDSGIGRLRYVAACRSGYYHQALAASSRHQPVDLTPPPGAIALGWYSDYRRHTIGMILTTAGVPLSEQHLAVCHDLPILAVFLAYLHTSGRTDDLAELLTEVEFGRWVAKRVKLSFPSQDISRQLALLISLFPITSLAAERLDPDLYRPVFDRLATDGWIERVSAKSSETFDTWVTAHDVLADQILLSYLRGIPNTADAFVAELFSLATDLNSLSSAIVSLQRTADSSPLSVVNWTRLITNAISTNESAWKAVRDALLRTSFLPVPDRIALLQNYQSLWEDAERDIIFQNSLGWFARWVAKSEGELPNQLSESLISWISKAVLFAEKNNFVITWGLRLAPEFVQEPALRWIQTRPTLFQTHYLMVAWLELGLPAELIAESVRLWCSRFPLVFHLSFILKAWLNAGGDKALVQDAITNWLAVHKIDGEAQFVYDAWLDAGGDKALVQDAITDWLVVHRTDAQARFVLEAWLDAGGDKALVQDPITDWLVVHKIEAEASYVFKPWLDAGGDKALIQDAIAEWLVVHKTEAEARFALKAWLDADGDKALVQDAITDWLVVHKTEADASHVFKAWLEAGGDKALVQNAITDWLVNHKTESSASYFFRAWLGTGGDKALIQVAITDWLVFHKSEAEAQFVYNAWLDAGGDKTLVQDAITDWLVVHKTEAEAQFVYDAWLDAGGDKALVQDAITDWLVVHKTDTAASHVFKAWLDADGDKAVVQEAVASWLLGHGDDADADYLFRSWLEAGGDRDLVWNAAIAWLAKHWHEESAVYVTKFIARQRDLSATTVRDVLAWCRAFPVNEDALWRLTQLGTNLLIAGVEEQVVSTADEVLADLLQPTSRPKRVTRGQVTTVFSYLIDSTQMQLEPLRNRVDSLFLSWFRHPFSFGKDPKPYWTIQRVSYLGRVLELIDSGAVELEKDREPLRRFMQWLDAWDIDRKLRLLPMLNEAKLRLPASDVWDIVRFEE